LAQVALDNLQIRGSQGLLVMAWRNVGKPKTPSL
jgi:hypothetical protein